LTRAAGFLRAAALALLLPCTALAASPEPALSGVLEAIESNRLDLALQRVEKLIADDHPNFRLAHLIRGDLLLARARPLQTFGNVAKTVPQAQLEDLRAEALVRLRAVRERRRPAACRARSCSCTRASGTRSSWTRAARACTFSRMPTDARAMWPTTT
jgi:hypothetical protein